MVNDPIQICVRQVQVLVYNSYGYYQSKTSYTPYSPGFSFAPHIW